MLRPKDFAEIVIADVVFALFSVNLHPPNHLVRAGKPGSKFSIHIDSPTLGGLRFKFVIRPRSKKRKVTRLGISRLEVVQGMWSTSVETQAVNGLRSHLLLTLGEGPGWDSLIIYARGRL